MGVESSRVGFISKGECMNDEVKKTLGQNGWDFIDVMEFVYAILMTWGFAIIALEWKFSWDYRLCLTIAALVLVRFFFVPSHDLRAIAEKTKDRPFSQRILFIIDVPIAIAHSFIYYRMCISMVQKNTPLAYNCGVFYSYFYLLLLLNVVWLVSISLREYLFEKELHLFKWLKRAKHLQFLYWAGNNALHLIIFVAFFMYTNISQSILFLIAFSNCLWDFTLTAPKYLKFVNKPFQFRYKFAIFLFCYLLPMALAFLLVKHHCGLF